MAEVSGTANLAQGSIAYDVEVQCPPVLDVMQPLTWAVVLTLTVLHTDIVVTLIRGICDKSQFVMCFLC